MFLLELNISSNNLAGTTKVSGTKRTSESEDSNKSSGNSENVRFGRVEAQSEEGMSPRQVIRGRIEDILDTAEMNGLSSVRDYKAGDEQIQKFTDARSIYGTGRTLDSYKYNDEDGEQYTFKLNSREVSRRSRSGMLSEISKRSPELAKELEDLMNRFNYGFETDPEKQRAEHELRLVEAVLVFSVNNPIGTLAALAHVMGSLETQDAIQRATGSVGEIAGMAKQLVEKMAKLGYKGAANQLSSIFKQMNVSGSECSKEGHIEGHEGHGEHIEAEQPQIQVAEVTKIDEVEVFDKEGNLVDTFQISYIEQVEEEVCDIHATDEDASFANAQISEASDIARRTESSVRKIEDEVQKENSEMKALETEKKSIGSNLSKNTDELGVAQTKLQMAQFNSNIEEVKKYSGLTSQLERMQGSLSDQKSTAERRNIASA